MMDAKYLYCLNKLHKLTKNQHPTQDSYINLTDIAEFFLEDSPKDDYGYYIGIYDNKSWSNPIKYYRPLGLMSKDEAAVYSFQADKFDNTEYYSTVQKVTLEDYEYFIRLGALSIIAKKLYSLNVDFHIEIDEAFYDSILLKIENLRQKLDLFYSWQVVCL